MLSGRFKGTLRAPSTVPPRFLSGVLPGFSGFKGSFALSVEGSRPIGTWLPGAFDAACGVEGDLFQAGRPLNPKPSIVT